MMFMKYTEEHILKQEYKQVSKYQTVQTHLQSTKKSSFRLNIKIVIYQSLGT